MKDLIIIALSGFLLWHLFNIWYYGEFYIAEPNAFVLNGEIALVCIILIYSMVGFIRGVKK